MTADCNADLDINISTKFHMDWWSSKVAHTISMNVNLPDKSGRAFEFRVRYEGE